MKKQKQYLAECRNCKKQTPHFLFKVSIKKGGKLQCSKCGRLKIHFRNLNLLHLYEPFKEEAV